jgi:hypothetical protein
VQLGRQSSGQTTSFSPHDASHTPFPQRQAGVHVLSSGEHTIESASVQFAQIKP